MLCRIATLLVVAPLFVLSARGQSPETYAVAPESELRIEGDSNRSAWTVFARGLRGTLALVPGDVPSVVEARFVIPTSEIVSDKSVLMDRNMYKALEVEAHPEITYELTTAATEVADEGYVVQASGTLTLHGEARPVELTLMAMPEEGGYRFRGDHVLDMTDYGVEPPVAAFGAWRVAREVVVHIDLLATPAG